MSAIVTDIDVLKETAQAVVRAFCTQKDIDIHFTNTMPRAVGSAIYLREPQPSMNKEQILRWRGETDRAVLKLVFYDAKIISHYAPENPKASAFYHGLCRLYADLRGVQKYPGIALNLRCLFRDDLLDLGADFMDAPAEELWLYYIAVSFAPKLFEEKVRTLLLDGVKELPAQFDFYLLGLKDNLDDLEKFAKITSDMACYFFDQNFDHETSSSSGVANNMPTFQPLENASLYGESEALHLEEDVQLNKDGFLEDDQPSDDMPQKQSMQHHRDLEDESLTEMDYDFEFPADAFEQFSSDDFRTHKLDYKIYSKSFDHTVNAHDLCGMEERQMLRKELDFSCKKYHAMTSKLASKLQAKLLALRSSLSMKYLTEGYIDPKKIASFIADPMQDDIFKITDNNLMRDVSLTLLIDCSGSMRGRPMTTAAVSADIIASTLEKCGVKVEILGFTTAGWKGGKVKKAWEEAGAPPLPGRLNDLLHVIFKESHAPWRRAREDLGVLLKESLLKENIDGEALLWAHDRLMKASQQRKILMVISDGAPVDDSTFSANDSSILERHLRNVIDMIEKKSPIELTAIGIGHDVTRYYNNAVTIRNVDKLTEVMMDQFVTLFDSSKRKS